MSKRIPKPAEAPREPFDFGCSLVVFPPEEIAALNQHGHALQALAAGQVKPVTKEQKHFLKVDRDEAEPETLLERAWARLKGRREYEREELAAAPPPEPKDYGIVEFDADRCWW
jgi:uncharacterized protein YifE (UPF0438 family)